MGTLHLMDRTGDVRVAWNADKEEEVTIARDAFRVARAKGCLAYKVRGDDWRKGEQLHDFDPAAERIVMTPALIGG